jgi:hypothetical protein
VLEKDRVVDAVTELFMATDRRDWAAVRDVFAPEVLFDLSSLTGTAAAALTGASRSGEVGGP